MRIATVRETVNLKDDTLAVSPFGLKQVLANFATTSYVTQAIAEATIDPSQIDLSAYAKKTDLPTKLSQLTNDSNYVQTVGGLIPSQYLPAYVDDVLEYANVSAFPNPGDAGKIYVALDTNLTYRWSGSEYVEISKSLALGELANTAYRGDRGKIAYDHSQLTGNAHGLTLSDLSITVAASVINYLAGLDGNIMTKLNSKLNISGGTMTGVLILAGDPTDKLHAATKDYVDKEIQGISVTVNQHVTQIADLQQGLEGLTSTVGTQADTLVDVQNSLTGLDQLTASHTSSISQIEQDASAITLRVTSTEQQVTILNATVNLLELQLNRDNVVVQVDEFHVPLESHVYEVDCKVLFRGNEVTPDQIVISNNNVGVACAYNSTDKILEITVTTSNQIPNTDNPITITAKYTSGTVLYQDSKVINVPTVLKGATTSYIVLESTNGLQFKNNMVSTDINAIVYHGGTRITSLLALRAAVGSGAYLQWKWKHMGDSSYTNISSSDSRLSNDGFTFTLSPQDVSTQVTFICEVIN